MRNLKGHKFKELCKRTQKGVHPAAEYTGPRQLFLPGFETPFYNQLDPENRWVKLSDQIPWDDLVSLFNKHNPHKPTGRPPVQAVDNHVRPGERNPIKGKFGQVKNGYGINRIRARLKETSQSWIASIILVLTLVKLAGEVLLRLGFSAWEMVKPLLFQAIERLFGRIGTKNNSDSILD